jgi:hypothetical protein
MYTSYASINIAGTTRTEVILGETCSVSNDEGDTISGMAIAFIEQGHYVTVFIVGATSSATLSSDTTLSGILSGISFVTTKPADANAEDSGGSGGGSNSSDTPFTGTASRGQFLCVSETGAEIADYCASPLIPLVGFSNSGYIIVIADQSTNTDIWAVSGCDEYQADFGSQTGVIGPLSPGARITNPCKFELLSNTSLGGSLYFTYNQDETYLVEQAAD